MAENSNDVPELVAQADNNSILSQISPARSIDGSENVEDTTVRPTVAGDADSSHTAPSATTAEPPSQQRQAVAAAAQPSQQQDETDLVGNRNAASPAPKDQLLPPSQRPQFRWRGQTMLRPSRPVRFKDQTGSVDDVFLVPDVPVVVAADGSVQQRPDDQPLSPQETAEAEVRIMGPGLGRSSGVVASARRSDPEHEAADAAVHMASAAAPPQPAYTNKVGPRFKDQTQHVPWPENENAEDRPAPVVVEEDPIAQAEVLDTVIPMADVIHIANSPPPPQDTTTVVRRQQQEAVARIIRRYAVYLLLLIVVVLAAATVGGVCGSGKCSPENPSSTEAPAPTPVPSSAPMTMAPIEVVPTPAPPSAAAARATAITALINNITLTNKTIAYPPVKVAGLVPVEEQALQFLIEDDRLNLTASDRFRVQQCYALLTFWFRTAPRGDWTNNTGWLTAKTECDWFGISCMDVVAGAGKVQSAVEKITMPSNNIQGSIPVDLGLLPNLEAFNLSGNSLSGSLPESIGRWRNLKWFDVSSNRLSGLYGGFTGSLPASIGLLRNLTHIDLSSNSFSGSLPESIGSWSNLKTFDLSYNSFAGSLPESIGNWGSLESFVVSSNNYGSGNAFTGTLPESIGNWSNLKMFDLSDNSFSGSLPDWIGNWTALETFNTGNNAMTGTLPASIGQWTALTDFQIYYNSYNGTLPASIGNWSKLVSFYVYNNALTGTIPKSIENWKNISRAYFDSNNFTGTMPTGICNAINASLYYVNLSADCSLNCSCCTTCL